MGWENGKPNSKTQQGQKLNWAICYAFQRRDGWEPLTTGGPAASYRFSVSMHFRERGREAVGGIASAQPSLSGELALALAPRSQKQAQASPPTADGEV